MLTVLQLNSSIKMCQIKTIIDVNVNSEKFDKYMIGKSHNYY